MDNPDGILQAVTGKFRIEIDVHVLDQRVDLQVMHNLHPYVALGALDMTKDLIIAAMKDGSHVVPVPMLDPNAPPGVLIPFRRPD